ncbi:MAG: hypothetical protein OEZ08_06265 [Betaproteobacteria bacterium]|nr:hypothetical protein [Betaproteobacteria bacterium]
MLFAILVGIILGLRGVETPIAVAILAAAIGIKVVIDVKWERLPYFGAVSPYVVYRHNLERAGERTDHAWISYALQLLVFGGLLGGTAYVVVSLLKA